MSTDQKTKKAIFISHQDYILANATPIYRYISLGQFIHLVQTKNIYFSKVINWDDPNEGVATKGFIGYFEHSIRMEKESLYGEWIKERNYMYDYIQIVYGSSWSLIKESDALWRIYSPNHQGIKIKTTIKKLKKISSNIAVPLDWKSYKFTIGKVQYNEPELYDIPITQSFLHKEAPFFHEQELRVIVYPDIKHFEDIKNMKKPKVLYSNIGKDFIESVKIDPRAETWIVDAIIKYCHSNNIFNAEQSNLYKPINFHYKDSMFGKDI